MKKNLFAAALVALTATGAVKAQEANFNYNVDRFADVQVLRYQVPGFNDLSLRQKTLVYYLTEAALNGRDILFDQDCKYNLQVRRVLEAIYTNYKGDKNTADYKGFLDYLKQVWFGNGIHHHYSMDKFKPEFSQAFFDAQVKKLPKNKIPLAKGQTVASFLQVMDKVIFDPTFMAKRVNLTDGQDLILTSANNLYEGVTQKEVEDYYRTIKDPNDKTPISYGLNTKVVKENGKVVEKAYKIGGVYSKAITKIVENLKKALPYAENEAQKGYINKLIEFYTTGSLKTFDEYSILWAQDTKSEVDFINGFIENFVALPIETGGEIKEWKDQLKLALPVLDSAMNRADSVQQKALVHTLKARVYYRLGEENQAIAEARASLNLSKQLLWQVTFDGLNGIANLMQDDIWKTMYQPLPRLDFLDPKYFQLKSTDECPINIAKAEENHLIVAEAMLSQGEIEQCKQELKLLLELVSERKVQQGLADHLEGRYNGGFWHYPDSSAYEVAASPQDPYRKGLVLDRKAPHLIDIPYISGTSVTLDMINDCKQTEELLELVYLMRQEIFIAEGRRMNDLGIKLPICQVEAGHRAEAQPYRRAFIPPFIPLDRGMDAFDLDVKNHRVTIKYNMNKIIVANRNTPWVAPFVHD